MLSSRLSATRRCRTLRMRSRETLKDRRESMLRQLRPRRQAALEQRLRQALRARRRRSRARPDQRRRASPIQFLVVDPTATRLPASMLVTALPRNCAQTATKLCTFFSDAGIDVRPNVRLYLHIVIAYGSMCTFGANACFAAGRLAFGLQISGAINVGTAPSSTIRLSRR